MKSNVIELAVSLQDLEINGVLPPTCGHGLFEDLHPRMQKMEVLRSAKLSLHLIL